jgi:hypothetical protein
MTQQSLIECACRIDHDIYTAKFLHSLREDGFYIGFHGDIARRNESRLSLEVCGYGLELLRIATDENDTLSPGFRPSLCNSLVNVLA